MNNVSQIFDFAQVVNARLENELVAEDTLSSAMRYAVLNGGKRMRAILVRESARVFGISEHLYMQVAMAIECMHAYSLVHDDLPAMDDDDLRRGQPTVHIKWDEATAILAADALQSKAFGLIAKSPNTSAVSVQLLDALAERAQGMVKGQMLDLEAEKQKISFDALMNLHRHKTGDLIVFCTISGAIIAGKNYEALLEYGLNLGAAFQIQDDILDVESNSEVLGKTVGKDQNAGKSTAVSILGLKEAKRRAQTYANSAQEALDFLGGDTENLRFLAQWAINRSQ